MLSGRLAPGIGITVGPSASSHASATCCGETSCASAAALDRVDVGGAAGVADAAERRPGQERDPALAAEVDLALDERRREAERQLVLDGDDLRHAQRLLELVEVAVGEADPADLALVLELLERADGLGVGHVRVGAVVLVEVDPVGAERLQRRLAGLADVLGAAVDLPRAARTDVAGLGGDDHVVVAALQRLGDQPLVVADLVFVLAVGVGGVDQVHAGVERGVDRADRLLLRRAAREGHRHRAEPDRKTSVPASRRVLVSIVVMSTTFPTRDPPKPLARVYPGLRRAHHPGVPSAHAPARAGQPQARAEDPERPEVQGEAPARDGDPAVGRDTEAKPKPAPADDPRSTFTKNTGGYAN